MENYFKAQQEAQKQIVNEYKPLTERKNCVMALVEKANKLAERHLKFVNAKHIPKEVSEWHEGRFKLNMEIGARLIRYYQSL